MITNLKVGDIAYLANRRDYTARVLGEVLAIREGITRIDCVGLPLYDSRSNIKVRLADGTEQWFDRLTVETYSEIVRIGFELDGERL